MYGLIGKPLGGSFSARWFGERGVDYRNFELDSIAELPALLAAPPPLKGFNVTSPYKEAVLPYLSALSPTAAAIGAVNCVSVECASGKPYSLIGHNTDAPALVDVLSDYLQDCDTCISALILGTGGAARAAMWVLAQLGIGFTVVSRRANPSGDAATTITYNDLTEEIIADNKLIINATPVGMLGHNASAAANTPSPQERPTIPYDALGSGHLLFDMIYNPAETEFLRAGRLHGTRTLNGLPMLVRQAELSAKVWGLEF